MKTTFFSKAVCAGLVSFLCVVVSAVSSAQMNSQIDVRAKQDVNLDDLEFKEMLFHDQSIYVRNDRDAHEVRLRIAIKKGQGSASPLMQITIEAIDAKFKAFNRTHECTRIMLSRESSVLWAPKKEISEENARQERMIIRAECERHERRRNFSVILVNSKDGFELAVLSNAAGDVSNSLRIISSDTPLNLDFLKQELGRAAN